MTDVELVKHILRTHRVHGECGCAQWAQDHKRFRFLHSGRQHTVECTAETDALEAYKKSTQSHD